MPLTSVALWRMALWTFTIRVLHERMNALCHEINKLSRLHKIWSKDQFWFNQLVYCLNLLRILTRSNCISVQNWIVRANKIYNPNSICASYFEHFFLSRFEIVLHIKLIITYVFHGKILNFKLDIQFETCKWDLKMNRSEFSFNYFWVVNVYALPTIAFTRFGRRQQVISQVSL